MLVRAGMLIRSFRQNAVNRTIVVRVDATCIKKVGVRDFPAGRLFFHVSDFIVEEIISRVGGADHIVYAKLIRAWNHQVWFIARLTKWLVLRYSSHIALHWATKNFRRGVI